VLILNSLFTVGLLEIHLLYIQVLRVNLLLYDLFHYFSKMSCQHDTDLYHLQHCYFFVEQQVIIT